MFRNALQGIGKSYVSMMAGVAELAGRIVAALILSKFLGFAGVNFIIEFTVNLIVTPVVIVVKRVFDKGLY